MTITELQTGEQHEAVIEPVAVSDYKAIKLSKQFTFKWKAYAGQSVYKLRLATDNLILGLTHIESHPNPGFDFMEIKLVEVGMDNKGKNKKYGSIAGCLISYACKQSIINGHDGFVMLIAKTQVAQLYESKYGFVNIGSLGTLGERMVSDEQNARALIKKYLGTLTE